MVGFNGISKKVSKIALWNKGNKSPLLLTHATATCIPLEYGFPNIKNRFKHTEGLKEGSRDYPYTHHLNSTMEILLGGALASCSPCTH